MGPTSSSDTEPTLRGYSGGTRVFGRYTLVSVLGRGGMGVVWRARDETLGEDVALKFLPDAVRWDPSAYEDLKDETRRARQLTHPNIVRIHDFVEDAGSAAISMELVEGETLTAIRMARPARVLEPAEITPWLPQLGAALDYAHADARVVHRDLKPTNLMLTRDGRLKIADFGVARSMADSITRVSMMSAGTLVYMSPQQAMGEEPVAADDIYAVGATLYELLAGKPPFHTGDVRMQLFQRKPDAIAARRKALGVAGEVPAAWEAILAACLAKDAAGRPSSAGELARRLCAPALAPVQRRWRRPTRREWGLGFAAVAAAALTALTWDRGAVAADRGFPSDATRAAAAWNFDGDTRDASGRGHDGANGRAVPTQDRFGRIDRAMKFNGNTGVFVPDAPVFRMHGGQPFTAAIWMRQDESPTLNGAVWVAVGSEVGSLTWTIGFDEGRVSAGISPHQQEGGIAVRSPMRPAVGEWCHAAMVSDGKDLRLYVNGGSAGSAPLQGCRSASAPSKVLMHFGRPAHFTPWALTGALDDARFWRRALSAEEIAALVVRQAPPYIAISPGQYAETDDIGAAVRMEYGEGAGLLDWSELKRLRGDDVRAWADDMGIPVGSLVGWVQRDGQRRFDEKRHYFVHRFDGVKPDYYMVHDECGGLGLALGSWYQSRAPLLVALPAPPIATEVLRLPGGEAAIRREGRLGVNRVAAALTWRARITPASGRVATVSIRLADLREYEAICEATAGAVAVALAPKGERGVSHSLPPNFGEYEFTLVAKNRRLSYRAISSVGGNMLFQGALAAPEFELDDVVAIEITPGPKSGLAAATLIVE